MFNNKQVLGIIPARGGSKRLPGKNTAIVNNYPLIAWTILAGLGSRVLDKLVVSTEVDEIGRVAVDWGVHEVIPRSIELATDDASLHDVIVEVLTTLESRGEVFDYLLLLQPTSPLRTAYHIDEAFDLINRKGGVGAISVCRAEHPKEWMGKLSSDGVLDSFIRETRLNKQSQDFGPTFQINGAIYIIPIDRFLLEDTLFLESGMVAYVMDRSVSVDIDEAYDLKLADWLLETST